jgi:hypothetical protein
MSPSHTRKGNRLYRYYGKRPGSPPCLSVGVGDSVHEGMMDTIGLR